MARPRLQRRPLALTAAHSVLSHHYASRGRGVPPYSSARPFGSVERPLRYPRPTQAVGAASAAVFALLNLGGCAESSYDEGWDELPDSGPWSIGPFDDAGVGSAFDAQLPTLLAPPATDAGTETAVLGNEECAPGNYTGTVEGRVAVDPTAALLAQLGLQQLPPAAELVTRPLQPVFDLLPLVSQAFPGLDLTFGLGAHLVSFTGNVTFSLTGSGRYLTITDGAITPTSDNTIEGALSGQVDCSTGKMVTVLITASVTEANGASTTFKGPVLGTFNTTAADATCVADATFVGPGVGPGASGGGQLRASAL
jgi:hypothetical protein